MFEAEISGKYSGDDYHTIDSIEFILSNSTRVSMNRGITSFCAKDGIFCEEWKNISLLDGEDEEYDYEDSILDGAILNAVLVNKNNDGIVSSMEVSLYSSDNPENERRFVQRGNKFVEVVA